MRWLAEEIGPVKKEKWLIYHHTPTANTNTKINARVHEGEREMFEFKAFTIFKTKCFIQM